MTYPRLLSTRTLHQFLPSPTALAQGKDGDGTWKKRFQRKFVWEIEKDLKYILILIRHEGNQIYHAYIDYSQVYSM